MVVVRKIIFILALLLALPFVQAEFTVVLSPENAAIQAGETAEFKLRVIHNLDQEYFFEIYSPEVEWDISTRPSSDRVLKVKPGIAKTTILRVRPLYVKTGAYAVPINVKRSGTNDLVTKGVLISVFPPEDQKQQYSPAVSTEVTFQDKIDPRKEVLIVLTLKNQNRRKLDKVDVKIRCYKISNWCTICKTTS